eukprot:5850556-Pyramimonas_sp.AAC.1
MDVFFEQSGSRRLTPGCKPAVGDDVHALAPLVRIGIGHSASLRHHHTGRGIGAARGLGHMYRHRVGDAFQLLLLGLRLPHLVKDGVGDALQLPVLAHERGH